MPPSQNDTAAVYCVECEHAGRTQRVEHRLGAWICPVHQDRGTVRFVPALPTVPTLKDQFIDTAEGITLVVDDNHIRGATKLELQMREALQDALKALYDARCGLDLGLGCARDIEGDRGPRPTKPRSAMQEAHLERARAAWRKVREVLGER